MLFGFPRIFAACLAVTTATVGCALQPHTPLARLERQSWNVENGLPQNTVTALLQTRTGFLMAGTESGLARFDGTVFRVFDRAASSTFPDAETRCLLDTSKSEDGGFRENLWVGTAEGVVHLQGSRATLLTARDGLPGNSVRGLEESRDGTVWAWTDAGLARWNGSRFETVPLPKGHAGASITSIAADGHAADGPNGVWVGTSSGLLHYLNGAWGTAMEPRLRGSSVVPAMVAPAGGGDVLISNDNGVFLVRDGPHAGVVSTVLTPADLPQEPIAFLVRLSSGAIAIATRSTAVVVQTSSGGSSFIGSFAVESSLPGSRIESVFADREGSLWIGTNRGLARITTRTSTRGATTTAEVFPATDTLAKASVLSLLEDREGDLWVGTETGGLQILRDARFRTIEAADGLSSDNTTAIVEDSDRSLWVGTRDAGLNRVSKSQNTVLTTANGLLSDVILSLAAARDGAVWVGTPDGLNRIGSDRSSTAGLSAFTAADGLPDNYIRALLAAPDGSLWIGTRHGLSHLDHGHFQNWGGADGLGGDLAGALARTPDGDLWIATLDGLTRLHRGRFHTYTTADGLSSNVITALEAGEEGRLWIGTQNEGLNLWDGEHFTALSGQKFPGASVLPAAVHALLRDGHGNLWLASSAGLTRVDIQALVDCSRQRPCRLDGQTVVNFSTADGLRSRETSTNAEPTAWRGADGQLWFTSPRGVIAADPLHFPANPEPPPVVMERFIVDDREEEPQMGTMQIGAGHHRFQFDYAGLSFAYPHRVRYQYILEGFDRGWIDAGTRRTAFYSNIPPGSYRFRVRATMDNANFTGAGEGVSEDATGTPAGASLAFTLLPYLYQTRWFRLLTIVTAAALLLVLSLVLMRYRVLRVERQLGAVMAERNRIAREIHDTLAQGYVGISLQLEILGELLRHNKTDAAARHLAVTQGLVRDGLDDARQSIWALRSQDAAETAFPIRLRRLVEQAGDKNLEASIAVHGAYRALPAAEEQELLRIAQEAVQNVKLHAEATRLQVLLEYDADAVALTISDNGKGFTVETPAQPGAPLRASGVDSGHFGLIGMQERAAVLKARVEIASAPGLGTTIRLQIATPSAGAGKTARTEAPAAETAAVGHEKIGKESS